MDPVTVCRRSIHPGPAFRAASESVAAPVRARLLDPEAEMSAVPLAHEAIVELQAWAAEFSQIDPGRAAEAVVAALRSHHLLPHPVRPEQLSIPLTEETAA